MITFVSVFLYVQSERNEYSREDSSDQFPKRKGTESSEESSSKQRRECGSEGEIFCSEFIRIRCIILNCIDQSSDLKKIHVNLLTTSFIKTNGNLLWLSLFIASTSASFELGIYYEYEIEFINDRKPLLSISASEFKTYTDNVGPFHPVKLLLHAHGHYEVRVNIVKHAETGKYEFDNFDFLRGLITNVSNQSPLHICPGLRDIKTWTQSSDACSRNCSARKGLGLLLTTWDTFKFKVFNLAYAKKKKKKKLANGLP